MKIIIENFEDNIMYKLIKKQGKARLGEFETVHGTAKTPAFMNVATCGAIKGALDAYDLCEIFVVRSCFAIPIIFMYEPEMTE